jgi:hypothetical protein
MGLARVQESAGRAFSTVVPYELRGRDSRNLVTHHFMTGVYLVEKGSTSETGSKVDGITHSTPIPPPLW